MTPSAEETLWRGSPSWTLLLGRLVLAVLALVAIPSVYFIAQQAAVSAGAASAVRLGLWIAAGVFLLLLGWFLAGLVRLRSTMYTLTNQRIMIETGLLAKELGEIDLRYVEDSQFEQGIFERLLGIGQVKIISSDKSTPAMVLQSIRDPRGVRETIRAQAYSLSQRQLFTRAT